MFKLFKNKSKENKESKNLKFSIEEATRIYYLDLELRKYESLNLDFLYIRLYDDSNIAMEINDENLLNKIKILIQERIIEIKKELKNNI